MHADSAAFTPASGQGVSIGLHAFRSLVAMVLIYVKIQVQAYMLMEHLLKHLMDD